MNLLNNSKNTNLSRNLRKNMTKEERKLWYEFLKNLPITINRQKVVGNYILDFYCASKKIAIELDGSQHFSEKNSLNDKLRDSYLNSLGITVLRYANNHIWDNFDGVCQDILNHLNLN